MEATGVETEPVSKNIQHILASLNINNAGDNCKTSVLKSSCFK